MTTNRRIEDFNTALDAAREGRETDPSMYALLGITGALAALPLRPAPAFRDALRTRLMAEAARMVPPSTPATPAPRVPSQPVRTLPHLLNHPAVQVGIGGLATVIAATGVGVGASRSLPGDPLYGLKRAIEGWQVGLSGGNAGEGHALLEHAQTRLDEIRSLLGAAHLTAAAIARIDAAIAALDSELRRATDRLLAAARDGSQVAYDRLSAAVADIGGQLAGLLSRLPATSRTAASAALRRLDVARTQLAVMPRPTKSPSPGPSPTSTSPSPSTSTPAVTGPPSTPPVTKPPTSPPTTPPITPPPVTVPPTIKPSVSVPPLP